MLDGSQRPRNIHGCSHCLLTSEFVHGTLSLRTWAQMKLKTEPGQETSAMTPAKVRTVVTAGAVRLSNQMSGPSGLARLVGHRFALSQAPGTLLTPISPVSINVLVSPEDGA
jgi:hypothetical protein